VMVVAGVVAVLSHKTDVYPLPTLKFIVLPLQTNVSRISISQTTCE
jgi:hypothetical protein